MRTTTLAEDVASIAEWLEHQRTSGINADAALEGARAWSSPLASARVSASPAL
jgi:hypothetical protein